MSLNQQRIEILTGGIYLSFYNILIKFNIFTSYGKRKNLSKFEYFIKSRVVSSYISKCKAIITNNKQTNRGSIEHSMRLLSRDKVSCLANTDNCA